VIDKPKLELRQVDYSESSITVAWNYDEQSLGVPLLYKLKVDLVTVQWLPTEEKVYTLRNIRPCHSYNLTLEAVFPSTTLSSERKTMKTKTQVPREVRNLRLNKNQVLWDPPINSECVSKYEVCFGIMEHHAQETCHIQEKSPVTFDLDGCASFNVHVTGLSADDKRGTPVSTTLETDFKEPEIPKNLTIEQNNLTKVELSWDLASNYPCIESYSMSFKPNATTGREILVDVESHVYQKHQRVHVHDLTLCTDYLFELSVKSVNGTKAKSLQKKLTFEDIEPEAISNLEAHKHEVQDVNSTSMDVTWNTPLQAACVGRMNVCLINDRSQKMECKDENKISTSSAMTFNGMDFCTSYTVLGRPFSTHDKIEGPSSSTTYKTEDKAPGSALNLRVDALSPSSLAVYFDPPKVRPYCVVGYDMTHTEQTKTFGNTSLLYGASITPNIIDGLKPCMKYKVSIVPMSASKLEGPEAVAYGTTKAVKPDPPKELRAIGTGTDYVQLAWGTPANRLCADSYTVKYQADNTTSVEVATFKKTEQMTMLERISKLQKCTFYNFEVVSTSTAKGASESSNKLRVETLC